MSGYSGTPLARKLGIRPDDRICLLGAPDSVRATIAGDLPGGVRELARPGRDMDLIVAFFTGRATLARRLPALERAIDADGSLWIAWPKRTSPLAVDITEDTLREFALPRGLVDNKVCAIDQDWSGLRFVFRRGFRDEIRAMRVS